MPDISSSPSPLIVAKNLSRTLSGEVPVTLVKDASLSINPGELVVINGPSGSGKSSLLYLLGLLDRPTTGSLILDEVNTTELNDDDLARFRLNRLGFVFQFHFLLPEFSALENVLLPMQKLALLTRQQAEQRALMLLEQLGLKEQAHKRPKQISGGQAQRVAIARALANDPSVILADEPTGNLDTKSSATVRGILKDLAHSGRRAVVAVSHEADFAKEADRLITIVDGRIRS